MSQRFLLDPVGQEKKHPETLVLIFSMFMLLGFGLSILLSSSYYRGTLVFRDPYYFFRNQVMFAIIGLIAAGIVSRIPVWFIRKYIAFATLLTLILLAVVFVPGLGLRVLGGRRWIQIWKFTFQPSELAKVVLVLYLSHILAKKQEDIHDIVNTLLPPILVTLGIVSLVILQNDFSTAMFLAGLALVMFFAAGVNFFHLLGLSLVGTSLGILGLLSKETRVERLITFLSPERDPIGTGFQVLSSRIALMNGGMTGMGVGQGVRKLGGLPEANSDFIFAVLGEEMGFAGIVLVILLFGLFAYGGYRISYFHGRSFIGLASFGLTSMILFQTLMNIAVVTGILPPTGITLPFFSSGGSSLIIVLLSVGLLIGFSQQEVDPEGISND